jgi:hypothetical protein
MKHIGKRSAEKPHAAFDEAGTGNVEWFRYCDTHKQKGELMAKIKFDLNQRSNPRAYDGRKKYSLRIIFHYFSR